MNDKFNKTCIGCKNECKQFDYVKIHVCPEYSPDICVVDSALFEQNGTYKPRSEEKRTKP